MVERSLLKKTIDEWCGWWSQNTSQLVRRNLPIPLPKKNALALIGVRRGGKSFFALEMSLSAVQPVLYFNFEDPLFLIDCGVENLDELLSVFSEYTQQTPGLVIFDEIQNIKGWERWVRKAVDLEKFQLILTGSSAKLLSSEISTSIAGRCMEERIWPLSYAESLLFQKKIPHSEGEHLGELRYYLQWGGFPEVVLAQNGEEKRKLLKQYINDLVLKDIISRHQIRNKRALDQMIVHYFTNCSCLSSYTSIKKAYGINVETASEYAQYVEEAFLFFEVKRFHPNLKVQSRDPKKIYTIDTGLRNVYASSIQEDIGKLAENMVFIHLKRLQKEVTYFKEKGEVDFLLVHHGKPTAALQVCYSNLEKKETFDREVNSLLECLIFTKLKKGWILTLSREEKQRIQGKEIEFIPLFKWLMTSDKGSF